MGAWVSRNTRGAFGNRTDVDFIDSVGSVPMDTGHVQESSEILLAEFKKLVLTALHKDLCLGEEMQALLAEVAKAELAWQQNFEMQAQRRAALLAEKDDALQQATHAKQVLKSCEDKVSAMLQTKESHAEDTWQKEQPRNHHSKQVQDKFSALYSKVDQLTQHLNVQQCRNASLEINNSSLQTARHELSQSLQHQQANYAKSEEERQCLQNTLSMQSQALASKEQQLSQVLQVNKPVLNYLDATDTLNADTSTSIMKTIYTKQIQAPAKALFNNLKKDRISMLRNMFLHVDAVANSIEANKSVMRSILRKLFLSKVNFELDRALWGCQTTLDAEFKPFASKQQLLLNTQDLVGQQRPVDLQNDVKMMVNRYLGLHRELCKFWSDKPDPVTAVPVKTLIEVADGLSHSIFGPLREEAINQVRPYMQDILVGAMNLRVATETLHPLYKLYVPQQVFDGVCLYPGIAVISDVFFVQQEPQIILQAEVESLQ